MTDKTLLIWCLLLLACCLLPWLSARAQWSMASAREALSGRPLDPVEGVWQFPADGATLLITRASATTFRIVLLDSPDLSAKPGTEIGTAVVTATAGHYDASLSSRQLGNKRLKQNTMELIATDDGALQFKPYREKSSVSLKRWLYYFFRVNVVNGSSPSNTGALRLYPMPAGYKPCL